MNEAIKLLQLYKYCGKLLDFVYKLYLEVSKVYFQAIKTLQ